VKLEKMALRFILSPERTQAKEPPEKDLLYKNITNPWIYNAQTIYFEIVKDPPSCVMPLF
jgi:hypothetical protein